MSRVVIAVLAGVFCAGAIFASEVSKEEILKKEELEKTLSKEVIWVKNLLQKYPELLWFAEEGVSIIQEGTASSEGLSKSFFGKKYIELDRTLGSFSAMEQIFQGDAPSYEKLVESQKKEEKLSWESFQKLHKEFIDFTKSSWNHLSEEEMRQVLEVAVILGDVGKTKRARDHFPEIQAQDQDMFKREFIEKLQEIPSFSPSYEKLSLKQRELLRMVEKVDAHFGHMTHLEGGKTMFTSLKRSIALEDPVLRTFLFLIQKVDVMGALSHVDPRGAKVYTENTHRSIELVQDAVEILSSPNSSEKEAYESILRKRADWIGIRLHHKQDRVLARVAAMMRLFTKKEGKVIQKAFLQIALEDRRLIEEMFSEEKADSFPVTPTYMPAVLVNLMNNSSLGSTKEERLEAAIKLGLPFIAKVLKEYEFRTKCKEYSGKDPLCFNPLAGNATSKKAKAYFQQGIFHINPQNKEVILYFW